MGPLALTPQATSFALLSLCRSLVGCGKSHVTPTCVECWPSGARSGGREREGPWDRERTNPFGPLRCSQRWLQTTRLLEKRSVERVGSGLHLAHLS